MPPGDEHGERRNLAQSERRDGPRKPSPPKNVGPMRSAALYRERILQVKRWLASGYFKGDIKSLANQRWGVGFRTAEDYITKAKKEIVAETGLSKDEHRETILARIDSELLRGDLSVAELDKLLTLKTKILGLLAPLQVQGDLTYQERHAAATEALHGVQPKTRDRLMEVLRAQAEGGNDN